MFSASQLEQIASWQQALEPVLLRMQQRWDAQPFENSVSPTTLADGLLQWLEQFKAAESVENVGQLIPFGFGLLEDLQRSAALLELDKSDSLLHLLPLHIAELVAAHGGTITDPLPVVDAIAYQANRLRDPQELVGLRHTVEMVIDHLPEEVQADQDRRNPGRPWRVLLLNYAIIATRSHDLEGMDRAFAFLLERLPEEAESFFAQGMEQVMMDHLGYPEPVRQHMKQWQARHHRSQLH